MNKRKSSDSDEGSEQSTPKQPTKQPKIASFFAKQLSSSSSMWKSVDS